MGSRNADLTETGKPNVVRAMGSRNADLTETGKPNVVRAMGSRNADLGERQTERFTRNGRQKFSLRN
jgi:hypothetical protein